MLKRHFKGKLCLLLCHWDVSMPIQQKCSFHFHKHDENTISSEICPLQVLLINLHFRECKGFIWKKKRKEKKGDNKRRSRVLWSPLFFRWLQIHTYIHTLLRLPSTGLFSHNVNYYIILVIKKRKENLFTVVQLNSKYIQNYSKYIQNYFVWNILLKSLRLKLSISLVFLILSGGPFHSFGPRK